jgi:hypothetical protein
VAENPARPQDSCYAHDSHHSLAPLPRSDASDASSPHSTRSCPRRASHFSAPTPACVDLSTSPSQPPVRAARSHSALARTPSLGIAPTLRAIRLAFSGGERATPAVPFRRFADAQTSSTSHGRTSVRARHTPPRHRCGIATIAMPRLLPTIAPQGTQGAILPARTIRR